MSPKIKILLVGGGLITVNLVFAALLFVGPVHPEHSNVQRTPVPETTVHTTERVKHLGDPAAETQIDSLVVSPIFHKGDTIEPSTRVIVPVHATSTVLDAMRAYEKVSDTFSFLGKEYPGLGLFVEEIDGVRPAEGRYWMLYVNGTQATVGVSVLWVVPGDRVEWRYEE